MNSDDISDPKVRAFMINAIINGLKTSIKTFDERQEFSFNLCDTINDTDNGAFVTGDSDGILIEDIAGDTVGTILVQEGIIKFRSFIEYESERNPDQGAVLSRAILATIGYAAQWHSERKDEDGIFEPAKETFKVSPASGYLAGGPECNHEWDDDGFGIT